MHTCMLNKWEGVVNQPTCKYQYICHAFSNYLFNFEQKEATVFTFLISDGLICGSMWCLVLCSCMSSLDVNKVYSGRGRDFCFV